LISIGRALMTMRARVERDKAGTDAYGNKVVPAVWEVREPNVSCFVWFKSRREVADGGKIVTVEDIRGVFPGDADIARGDRISSLTDRRERKILEENLDVDEVTEQSRGPNINHKVALLRRHRG